MNIFDVLDNFGKRELLDAKGSRRMAFKQLTGAGKDLAKIAVPLGIFTAGSKSAFAQSSAPSIVDVLNYALTLEYLEAEFYQMGLDMNGLIPAEDRAVFAQISQHEDDHVEFLRTAISGAGGTPIDKPSFDFTAGGNFPTFSDYPTYMILSQAFEDTGVRAYKGQAANVMSNGDVLTAALQIHSVEARHASQVRRMRGEKGWIVQDNDSTGVSQVEAVYAGEQNTVQGDVDLAGMFGNFGGNDAVTEAFDEPLTMQEVVAIASLFIQS